MGYPDSRSKVMGITIYTSKVVRLEIIQMMPSSANTITISDMTIKDDTISGLPWWGFI